MVSIPTAVQAKSPSVPATYNRPEVRSKLLATGIEVVASSPEQAAAAIESEMSVMDRMIKDASLRTQ